MPLKVSFELSERDLKYFRAKMSEVRNSAKGRDEAEIIDAALERLVRVLGTEVPDFVSASPSSMSW